MPVIYTPNLTQGTGKTIGTSLTSGVIGDRITQLRGNDRSRPFSSNANLPVNLYFQIHGQTSSTSQTFRHVILISENVMSIQLRAGTLANVTSQSNLYTPGITQGLRLTNGEGRVTGTTRNVFKLEVTGIGTAVELRVTDKEVDSQPFYIYAFYLMSNKLETLRNDDKTSFSSYEKTSTSRDGIEQTDLYGDVTYQPAVNRSSKRSIGYTVWRVDEHLIHVDRWINNLIRTKDTNPNIILDEEVFTTDSSSYDFDVEENDLEAIYPAYWLPGVSRTIEGSGVKSVSFGFQES